MRRAFITRRGGGPSKRTPRGSPYPRTSISTKALPPSDLALRSSTLFASGLAGPVHSTTAWVRRSSPPGALATTWNTSTVGSATIRPLGRASEWRHPACSQVPTPMTVSIMLGPPAPHPSRAARSSKAPRSIITPVAVQWVKSHIPSPSIGIGSALPVLADKIRDESGVGSRRVVITSRSRCRCPRATAAEGPRYGAGCYPPAGPPAHRAGGLPQTRSGHRSEPIVGSIRR